MSFLKRFKYELLIALFFLASRLPTLGHDTFNTDVWKWKVRSYDFSSGIFGLDFAQTLQKYHPGVTLMWIGTVGIKISNVYTEAANFSELQKLFILHSIQKFLVVLVLAISISFIFYVLKTLFGNRYAVLASGLLILEPFYIAITREFHLEGLLSTFMLASTIWLYYFLQDKTQSKRLYVSAVFAGLSILTKTSSVYLVLFAGLMMLVQMFKSKSLKSDFLWFTKWFSLTLLTCFILWPALWVIPGRVAQDLLRGIFDVGVDTDHIQFYFGKLVGDPGPFFYLVVYAFRSSIYLVLGLVMALFTFKKLDARQKDFGIYLFVYTIFYTLQLSIPSKKLDRYILPGIASLSLLTSLSWSYILEKVKLNTTFKYSVFFLLGFVTIIYLHPDYLSYYNPLFGGLRTGLFVIEPKWMIGQQEVITYFKNLEKAKSFEPSGQTDSFEKVITTGRSSKVLSVAFPEKYYTQIWPFFREINAWAVIQNISPFAVKTRYFVYPVWDDGSSQEKRFTLKYIDTINVRGVPVYRVYERII